MASKTLAFGHAALVIAALGTFPLSAQCNKPQKPLGGGYPTTSTPNVAVTYSDGYKTMGDLFYPSSPAPTCGWPLLVSNHEFSGNRKGWQPFAHYFASHGFALFSYDLRGHGDAILLNPNTTGFRGGDGTDQADLAEQIAFVRQKFPQLVSPTRVGYFGVGNLGGSHGFMAAAASGKTITAPGRNPVQFPVIAAVATLVSYVETLGLFVPDGTLFHVYFPALAFAPFSAFPVIWEPSFRGPMQQAWVSQDVATLTQNWQRTRFFAPALKTSNVPILTFAGRMGSPDTRELYETLAGMPATNPSKVLDSSSLASQQRGADLWYENTPVWFDRFLWGIANGVDNDAKFQAELVPPDMNVLRDPFAVLPYRHDASILPAGVTMARSYLTDQGSLVSSAPLGAYTPTQIQNRVAPSYDPIAYLTASTRSQVLTNIPLSERSFTMAPLAQDVELAGIPKVSLSVIPQHARFQVSAALHLRAPGSAADLQFASRGIGVLNAAVGVPTRIDLDLSPVMASLQKGTVIKVVVRNHWLLDDPQRSVLGTGMRTTPTFSNFDLAVRHGSGTEASTVDLPLRTPRVNLIAGSIAEYLHQARFVTFLLSGGSSRAGSTYITLVSASGHAPGISLPGGVLPLKFDAATDVFLQTLFAPNPFTFLFFGQLDARGSVEMGFDARKLMPLDPALSGTRLTFASWVTPNNFASGEASDPVDVILK